ncbi:TspO/MBR family protein [Phyllobacterium zundukense]|jgi:tryptophan-rich sensory protein|uniref:Tryptophan-rich sensory protein n=1 Tax=Phyllobacterium zundukense TaxID=1867719 RepID=A0ACD4D544_9HYPH|nr:TspO/MBR family protein [Phyllobacterium zundukense]UXN61013.1 tryptophan-rich sensory protein [Phyllobacterium zundukense]
MHIRSQALLLFLVLVTGGGLVIGYITLPGEWYAGLVKPSFNPPSWIWTILYILIAIAGWQVWDRGLSLPQDFRWAQLALNFLWSPTFFGFQQMGLALIVIVLLLITIIGFIKVTWSSEPVSALLFVPYLLWVAFASPLNVSLWRLNAG